MLDLGTMLSLDGFFCHLFLYCEQSGYSDGGFAICGDALCPRLLRGRLLQKQRKFFRYSPAGPNEHLPVVCGTKDAHWFPIILKEVSITITASFDNSLSVKRIFSENLAVTEPWFTREYALDVVNFRGHRLTIDCAAIVESGGHTFCVFNDNYTGLSHAPFNVYADSEPLPMESGWQMGDLHCHSSWTSDQVEFGLPPQAIPLLAK
jgi:hypothetical protein